MSTSPDGLFQYGGQPVGGFLWASPWSKVWFVDGYNGAAGNSGTKPTDAFSTIALATAAAKTGDVIYIRPLDYSIGHGVERYSEDVSITMTNTGYNHAGTTSYPLCQPSNISIIGTAHKTNPQYAVRWKPETATALTNTSPNLHVENIGFFAEGLLAVSLLSNGVTDTQRGIDGTSFYNCEIRGGGFTAADGGTALTIDRCRFLPKYDGDPESGFTYTCNVAPGRQLTIRNCEFADGNGTACLDEWITLVGTISEVIIRDCYFGLQPTNNAYIVAGASVTGLLANIYFADSDISTTGIEEGGLVTAGIYDGTGVNAGA
jgi:hypothetical protein